MSNSAAVNVPGGRREFGARPDGEFGAIQAQFRDLIIRRVLAFENLKKAIDTGPDARSSLREVAALSHKISGVAATLGYPHAGELASLLETTILRGLHAGGQVEATWAGAAPILEALLDALETILDE